MAIFKEICGERESMLEDVKANENQEAMQKVVTLMQDIVDASVRQRETDDEDWRDQVEDELLKLKVPI